MTAKPTVAVGMSGGVDSSVAAYLLKRAGYEVIGLTFINWPPDCVPRVQDKCCGPQALADAQAAANILGIRHYAIDEAEAFQREVIDYFVGEYRHGRTPNPCVVCNERIKFGSLLRKAEALGAEILATGHYARIEKAAAASPCGSARFLLKRGIDRYKDQSYFLFSLRQEQLARALMPLGELTKEQTRAVAKEIGLKNSSKAESQEVCFVPYKDYGRFLRERVRVPDAPGEIVTRDNKVLGHHDGIQYFTIGQREGLKIGGLKTPLYVVELDPESNRVVVGTAEELFRDEFEVTGCNWVSADEPTSPLELTVKIRYSHGGCAATIENLGDGRVRVHTREPQRAVTPGQAAVFYQGELVVGGGWIRL